MVVVGGRGCSRNGELLQLLPVAVCPVPAGGRTPLHCRPAHPGCAPCSPTTVRSPGMRVLCLVAAEICRSQKLHRELWRDGGWPAPCGPQGLGAIAAVLLQQLRTQSCALSRPTEETVGRGRRHRGRSSLPSASFCPLRIRKLRHQHLKRPRSRSRKHAADAEVAVKSYEAIVCHLRSAAW